MFHFSLEVVYLGVYEIINPFVPILLVFGECINSPTPFEICSKFLTHNLIPIFSFPEAAIASTIVGVLVGVFLLCYFVTDSF